MPVLTPAPLTPAVVFPPEELAQIRAWIAQAKIELEAARRDLRSVEEALDIQALGFYEPRYGFESSAQYVVRLEVVRDEQQALLKADTATHCATEWKVCGSAAEGRKMVKNQSKLMLRAFNGECDAAIAKVKYDNVTAMEERITRSSEAVNKLGLVQHVSITNRYFGLELAQPRLVHEQREKGKTRAAIDSPPADPAAADLVLEPASATEQLNRSELDCTPLSAIQRCKSSQIPGRLVRMSGRREGARGTLADLAAATNAS